MLLGTELYTESVDLWSVGCVFAFLILGKPLFNASTELEMIHTISSILGSFNEKSMPNFPFYPVAKRLVLRQQKTPLGLNSILTNLSALGVELMIKLLTYDPIKRISAEDALQHHFFVQDPAPDTKYVPSLN